ncbi:GAF and ANTAR domain-containing protein [Actinophytocola xinjiangensis]|uniref:GAF and ANTAR domain-containing protein n=1 Tax=Actinophytocola xinjiangensis TaxID=485602 RepID=UPI000AEF8756|nr:GAF and ANTAR domain-containing protein [Actinophytocola xinjiangensis]
MIDYRTLAVWQCIAEYASAHNGSVSISTVCGACVQRVGMSGAWLAWGNPPRDRPHATDPVAARLADLHVLLGQGPGTDAVREGRPIPVADLGSVAAHRSWPVFSATAQATGARAVAAFPLRVGRSVVGLFGLYSTDPVALCDLRRREVAVFADLALGLLLDRELPPHEDLPGWFAAEALVHQASGIISVQLGVDVDEALDRLRAHAFSRGRPLMEIAGEVVHRRLRFEQLSQTGPNDAPNS